VRFNLSKETRYFLAAMMNPSLIDFSSKISKLKKQVLIDLLGLAIMDYDIFSKLAPIFGIEITRNDISRALANDRNLLLELSLLCFDISDKLNQYQTNEKVAQKKLRKIMELVKEPILLKNRNMLEKVNNFILKLLYKYQAETNQIKPIKRYSNEGNIVFNYQFYKKKYGKYLIPKLLEIFDYKKDPETAFLIILCDVSIEARIALGKISEFVKSKDLLDISAYIFKEKALDKSRIEELIQKYPQFVLWLRYEDLYIVSTHVEKMLDKYPPLLVLTLRLGGVATKQSLIWLNKVAQIDHIPISAIKKVVAKSQLPFCTTKFENISNRQDLNTILKEIGAI